MRKKIIISLIIQFHFSYLPVDIKDYTKLMKKIYIENIVVEGNKIANSFEK